MQDGPVHEVDSVADFAEVLDKRIVEWFLQEGRMCGREDEEDAAQALVVAVLVREPFWYVRGEDDPAWGIGEPVVRLGH